MELADLKAQLNITFDTDDDLLQRCLDGASEHTQALCGGALPDPIPASLSQAVLMLAAHLYENREASFVGTVSSVPMGYDELVLSHREWAF